MQNDFLENQAEKRGAYLGRILESDHPRKLIVAGPGTGKTFTFGEVFRKSHGENNLALTFIRKLVEEMERGLGELAEVKTFHAYCKKLLHERNGRVELVPFLTRIVESDAIFLGAPLYGFDDKFQTLAEDSHEVGFYLARGDYYEAVSFNDSVYRLYRYVRDGAFGLPAFSQVVVDEFQDFNPLEVAFIEEIEKHGPVLIVGDDDQAVYIGRNSSPDHLRRKYQSGQYEVFQLPFCSRCPRVVVEATDAFIKNVMAVHGLRNRIDRPFFPYLEGKEEINAAYPKLVTATMSTNQALAKFICGEIRAITPAKIEESHEKGYPCVLVVGKRQYLNSLAKRLREEYANVSFTEAQEIGYSALDGYKALRLHEDANLGWRILAEFHFPKSAMRRFIERSRDGIPFRDILPQEYVEKQTRVIALLGAEQQSDATYAELSTLLSVDPRPLVEHFVVNEQEAEGEIDKTQPTILLSSFEGCKGLSAGHVFIVGLNDGIVPARGEQGVVEDIEYCKFIVALTRTLNRCYLLSNRWDYDPRGKEPFAVSSFIGMIPKQFLDNRGYLRAKDIQS
jgi:ATP-dependent DNA helicase UvrD/PcrA